MPPAGRLLLLALLLPAPFARADDADRRYYYEDIFAPFFTLDAGGKEYTATRPGAGRGSFPAQKAPDAFRVFVLGGSIAGRYMSGPHNLQEGFQKALPARRVEVLNAGMAGYDSAREALVLEEVLERSPDLVVLLSCHNERLGEPPIPLWLLHARDRLNRLEAFRELVAKLAPPNGVPPDPLAAAADKEAAFASNLRAMLRKARARGVTMLVAAPPLDYRDAPSDLRPPSSHARFWKGWLSYLRGQDAAALDAWASLLAELPPAVPDQGRSLLLSLMGRAARRSGAPSAAEYFTRAMDEDWYAPGRCSTRAQAAILKIGAEEGAVAVDLDAAFRRRAAPDVPGLDMFTDAVHWLERENAAVTAALVDAVRVSTEGARLPWSQPGVESLRALADKEAAAKIAERETLATLRYAFAGLRSRISVTPVASLDRTLSWRSVAFLEAVYDRHPGWFRDPSVLAARAERGSGLFGLAWGQRELTVDPVMARWYAGEVLLRRGDPRGALRAIDAALALDPALHEARLSRALALALLGDEASARSSLRTGFDPSARGAADALGRALDGAAD